VKFEFSRDGVEGLSEPKAGVTAVKIVLSLGSAFLLLRVARKRDSSGLASYLGWYPLVLLLFPTIALSFVSSCGTLLGIDVYSDSSLFIVDDALVELF
jgi:hypothetical protein